MSKFGSKKYWKKVRRDFDHAIDVKKKKKKKK